MIEQCLLNYDVDLNSYIIGNAASDIELASNVGCKSILVREEDKNSEPTYVTNDLLEAVNIITGSN